MNMDDKMIAHPSAEGAAHQFTVLAVDDSPENLDVLLINLRDLYNVRCTSNGESALKMAIKHKPDLILLDVMMPGIDGFETCRHLKKNHETADIPVIFVTSLDDMKDEKIGFAAGGVDYIIKPILPPILQARVKTHLDLYEAQRNIQQILKQTLSGTISVMTEVLCLANPTAFGRALRMRTLIQKIARRIGRPDAWQFEVSAILSQLGCVTLPTDELRKFQHGMLSGGNDQERFDHYPELSAKLVARIPRMEEIAKMVEAQLKPPCAPFHGTLKTRPAGVLGAQILKLAIDYDTLTLSGKKLPFVLDMFTMDQFNYDPLLVAIFAEIMNEKRIKQQLTLKELQVGMALADDLVKENGESILKNGTDLTPSVLNLMASLERLHVIKPPYPVWVAAEG
ncbi:MAG: response regulator [Magnetococcales bacterium]|nr:response regulator [Magnetococcales bacterium]